MAATALAVGGLAIASVPGAPAGAAATCDAGTIVVSNNVDSGSGSLRQAFADATTANGGTICIDTSVVTAPITLGGSALSYTGTGNLTVLGNGAFIDGNDASAVISVSTGSTLEIDDLTVTGGNSGSGAGVRNGGAGDVKIVRSEIAGNTASGFGAGVSAWGVTVVDSTISNNTVTNGDSAGISADHATVINSTITGNSASTNGGGISVFGAVTLVYSTVVGNTSPLGANVYTFDEASSDLQSFGSVVTNPLGGGDNCAISGGTSHGYNYSDDSSCGFTATGDVQDGADPQLNSLDNNGGPTETMAPLYRSSPLVDAIPVANCQDDGASGVTSDQRGVTRPQGSGCDIGAVEDEFVPPLAPLTPAAPVGVQPLFTG
jgi:hypothetical protein